MPLDASEGAGFTYFCRQGPMRDTRPQGTTDYSITGGYTHNLENANQACSDTCTHMTEDQYTADGDLNPRGYCHTCCDQIPVSGGGGGGH
jgi:hypothetical protein